MTRILLGAAVAALYMMLRDEQRNRAAISAALDTAQREREESDCFALNLLDTLRMYETHPPQLGGSKETWRWN